MTEGLAFWRGKRVLITGHTGFKGSWLAIWLQKLGSEVIGIALEPYKVPNLFEIASVATGMNSRFCDIRDEAELAIQVRAARPEVVFHLAAQPLVRASYNDPLGTFATNVLGTANLLNSLRSQESVRAVVMVTTDKVYRNLEQPYPYREDDALGGHDPYSASKAASEIVITSFRDAYLSAQGKGVASARAGNVIGGGDWSEDRLMPDAVHAWLGKQPLLIRNPQAIRPWQHVLDPLAGYLKLAQKLWYQPGLAGAYNFGPKTCEAATVREVVEFARIAFDGGEVIYHDQCNGPHEANLLSLEIAKARSVLGVSPIWGLKESVKRTIAWYKSQANGADARSLCEAEIDDYEGML